MAQINFAAHEQENQLGQHRNVKQFGASDKPRSTMKKTALSDVKNILAQRTFHSAKKPLASVTKTSFSKKNLIDVFDKENLTYKIEMKKDGKKPQADIFTITSNSLVMNVADNDIVEPGCTFCDKPEDDFADLMLKSIHLNKSEIDKLALEWERQPVVGLNDVRRMKIHDAILLAEDQFAVNDWPTCDYDLEEPDLTLLNDIPVVESIINSDSYEE